MIFFGQLIFLTNNKSYLVTIHSRKIKPLYLQTFLTNEKNNTIYLLCHIYIFFLLQKETKENTQKRSRSR